MVFSKRKKLFAVAFGSLVAAAPVLLFNLWVTKQGGDETSLLAQRVIALAEFRIEQARASLLELSVKGIETCRPPHVEVMRQAAFLSGIIKEFSIVNAHGETMCVAPAMPNVQRTVAGSLPVVVNNETVEVISVTGRSERLLRIRRAAQNDKGAIAASISSSVLIAALTATVGRTNPYTRLSLTDGTLIGTVGTENKADDTFISSATSSRYGLAVLVKVEREGLVASYEDLRRIGIVGTALVALLLLMLAVVIIRREQDNPFADVARALIAKEFVPYYQPVVDIQSGQLIGAEVLVRWRQRDGNIVGPSEFITTLEASGLIMDLTRMLMQQVAEEVGPAIGRRPQMSIAFNVAPAHLMNAVLLKDVGDIFSNSEVRFSQLVLEVTERGELEDLMAARRDIAALQGLGCRIAIDDVGTGHSGLSYILKLGVDIIKIDKLFVESIGAGTESKAIIETLVDLARNLRMEIIAEGVEHYDQVIYLREHGITAAQGWVFAPALSREAFLQLVDASDPMPLKAEPKDAGKTAAPKKAATPATVADAALAAINPLLAKAS